MGLRAGRSRTRPGDERRGWRRKPWTVLLPPGPSSSPFRPIPQGKRDGAGETFGPVKGHQGQRGSCLRAEKLAVCLEGSSSRFSSPLPWPGLAMGWEPCSWGEPAARPWAASPIGTRERERERA